MQGKVAKDGKVGQNVAKLVRSGLKWFEVVRSGSKPRLKFKVVRSGSKWFKT